MSRKKLSDEEVFYQVCNEGLDYFVTSYCSPEDIENPELSRLMANARDAINKFQEKLDEIAEEQGLEEI